MYHALCLPELRNEITNILSGHKSKETIFGNINIGEFSYFLFIQKCICG